MFSGNAISLNSLGDGVVEMVFDFPNSTVNKLNTATLLELEKAIKKLEEDDSISGLLLRSMKSTFVVGGDVSEFTEIFSAGTESVTTWAEKIDGLLNRIENLPFPSVAIINSLAVGGGLELALSCDYRVINQTGQVALPEVKLGLCPGWGGTVRLSRLIDLETSIGIILSGKYIQAEEALAYGLIDSVVTDKDLIDAAKALLNRAKNSTLGYSEQRKSKSKAYTKSSEVETVLHNARQKYGALLDDNYPATVQIFDAISEHVYLPFEDALQIEAVLFAELSQTSVASSLLGTFFNEQVIKKKTRDWIKKSEKVSRSAVIGAGIMGGGIAYQSSISKIPVVMKDINQEALDIGISTANKLLDRQIKKGKIDKQVKESVIQNITATMDYSHFDDVDLVVEAVVENAAVKTNVLNEVESHISNKTVLASNTSTISIDKLAAGLQRPELFCGMHFFNPVAQMPLVEVIRGSATSELTIAKTVAYANAMGKTPIVVKDCPGFLVNRVLFPYFNGFNRLLQDGVAFERIDQVMEKFGWPMGPAYLADVIGLDTMVHADRVLQSGFPSRMSHSGAVVIEDLVAKGALGQKNNIGFYDYGIDDDGKRYKKPSSLATGQRGDHKFKDNLDIDEQAIIDRMMIPLCTESIRCLEDGIVDSAAEIDMGLLLGLGFPRFRGGPLRYVDTLGGRLLSEKVRTYSHLGGLYELTDKYQDRVDNAKPFY